MKNNKEYIITALILQLLLISSVVYHGCGQENNDKQVQQKIEKHAEKKKAKKPEYVETTSFTFSGESIITPPEHVQPSHRNFSISTSGLDFTLLYGAWQPVGSFANRLENSKAYAASIVFTKIFWHIRPELHYQYVNAHSTRRENRAKTNLVMVQFLTGLRYEKSVFHLFNRHLTANLGMRGGSANLSIQSDSSTNIESGMALSYGINAGLSLDLFSWLALGVEANYQVVKATGDDIHARSLLFKSEIKL